MVVWWRSRIKGRESMSAGEAHTGAISREIPRGSYLRLTWWLCEQSIQKWYDGLECADWAWSVSICLHLAIIEYCPSQSHLVTVLRTDVAFLAG